MNKKRRTKRIKWITIGSVMVLLTGLISFFTMRPATLSYKKIIAQTGDISTYYSFSGNVVSKYRQTIISEKIMQISKIYVKEGDPVNTGDVLIKTATGDELKSKINGEVATIDIEENKQVTPGMLLIEIVDYNNLEVIFKADEYDVNALETGKEAVVNIPAIQKEFIGVINDISKEGQIVNGVTFYTSTIDIAQDGNMRTGMSAEVKLLSNKAEKVVILPMNVISFDEHNQPYVLKRSDSNDIIKKKITTGINDGIYVEIKDGVLADEEILYKNDFELETLLFPEGGKNTKFYHGGSKK